SGVGIRLLDLLLIEEIDDVGLQEQSGPRDLYAVVDGGAGLVNVVETIAAAVADEIRNLLRRERVFPIVDPRSRDDRYRRVRDSGVIALEQRGVELPVGEWHVVLPPDVGAVPHIGGEIADRIVLREIRVLRIFRHLIDVRTGGADRADGDGG